MQICLAGRSPGVTESMAVAEEGQGWTRGDGLSNSFGLMSCGCQKVSGKRKAYPIGVELLCILSRSADKRLCKSEV